MGFYNIDRPIHRIFAVFSGLMGIVSLLPAIATILERQSIWVPVFVAITFVAILFIESKGSSLDLTTCCSFIEPQSLRSGDIWSQM